MTLVPGTRLGPYEILAPLGAGVSGINNVRLIEEGERYVCSYTQNDSALFYASGLR